MLEEPQVSARQNKRIFILPTNEVCRRHLPLADIMGRYQYKWSDLINDAVTPLLDGISRGHVDVLESNEINYQYAGEVADFVIKEMISKGNYVDDSLMQADPAYWALSKEMFEPLVAFTFDLLNATLRYFRESLETPVSGTNFPYAISFDHLQGLDLVIAIYYTL